MRQTFTRLTVSWMDPHTTRKKARGCKECHRDPRALGLGAGSVYLKDGKWAFEPAMDAPALDAFVDISGRALVNFSRPGRLRAFNKNEIDRVLTVGVCLGCHSGLSFPEIRPISSKTLEAIPCQELKMMIP